MFSYVFLQFSKLYSLFLAPCTLFSCSPHIYESYCIHELGAHKYLLLPPLPKLWYHCACFPSLSFVILSWSCMIDASACVILPINIFHCHCHCQTHKHRKYDNNGKGGYFRFDEDNNMSYSFILLITYTKLASWTHTTPYIVMKTKANREAKQHVNHISTRHSRNIYMWSMPMSSLVWWWSWKAVKCLQQNKILRP